MRTEKESECYETPTLSRTTSSNEQLEQAEATYSRHLAVMLRHPSSLGYGDACYEDLRRKIGDTVKRAFD